MPVSALVDHNADLPDPDHELWGQETHERSALPFPEWHQQAACVGKPVEMFFGAEDTTERPALTMSDVNRAKAVCATCPVFAQCLAKALGAGRNAPREEYGIWAGTSGRTRRRIWEMVEREEVTLEQVIDDICAGVTERYERKQSITVSPVILTLSEAEAMGA